MLRAGVAWLDGRQDRPDWAAVFVRLADFVFTLGDEKEMERLPGAAILWLRGRQDHPLWMEVWQPVSAALRNAEDPRREELLAALGPWLRIPQTREQDGWGERLAEHLEAGGTGDDLLRLGAPWFSARLGRRGLHPLSRCLAFWVDAPQAAALAEWLADWLERNPKSPELIEIRARFRERIPAGRLSSESWDRLVKAVTRVEDTFGSLEDLMAKQESGEAVWGTIVARRPEGFSVRLGSITAYLPDGHLGAEPNDSWIGWQGLFAIEAVYLAKQLVIVARI